MLTICNEWIAPRGSKRLTGPEAVGSTSTIYQTIKHQDLSWLSISPTQLETSSSTLTVHDDALHDTSVATGALTKKPQWNHSQPQFGICRLPCHRPFPRSCLLPLKLSNKLVSFVHMWNGGICSMIAAGNGGRVPSFKALCFLALQWHLFHMAAIYEATPNSSEIWWWHARELSSPQ